MRIPSVKGYELRPHNPIRALFGLLLALLLLVTAGVALYWVGYRASGKTAVAEQAELAKLRSQVAYLQQRNKTLLDHSAQLGRAGKIDREAMRQVQATLNKMQGKIADLTEEISFYRSIVSPSKLKPGLHLQRFQVSPGGTRHEFNYHLVLTQVQDKHDIVKGRVSVHIVGQTHNHSKTLTLTKLITGSMDFSFHYFKDFSGSFVLPGGFVPKRVDIRVIPYTRKIAGVTKKLAWEQAMKGEG